MKRRKNIVWLGEIYTDGNNALFVVFLSWERALMYGSNYAHLSPVLSPRYVVAKDTGLAALLWDLVYGELIFCVVPFGACQSHEAGELMFYVILPETRELLSLKRAAILMLIFYLLLQKQGELINIIN